MWQFLYNFFTLFYIIKQNLPITFIIIKVYIAWTVIHQVAMNAIQDTTRLMKSKNLILNWRFAYNVIIRYAKHAKVMPLFVHHVIQGYFSKSILINVLKNVSKMSSLTNFPTHAKSVILLAAVAQAIAHAYNALTQLIATEMNYISVLIVVKSVFSLKSMNTQTKMKTQRISYSLTANSASLYIKAY